MSRRKRPVNIRQTKTSTRAIFHIGLVNVDVQARQKARAALGIERPERITFDDI